MRQRWWTPIRQPATAADLDEALAALDFLDAALQQSIGDRPVTGLQLSAQAVVQRLRRKHDRLPRPAEPRPIRPS
jgi:hypothetical protein